MALCERGYIFTEKPCEYFVHKGRTYRCEQLVGQGAFAYCFLYESADNERAVAKVSSNSKIAAGKEIPPELGNMVWSNELYFLRKCDHFNIVKFVAATRSSDLNYIFMEHVPRTLMEEHAIEPKMDEAKVARIMEGIFRALAYLHALHIAHRDIKLSNTLLTADNQAKLCDFGMARQLNDNDEGIGRPEVCGTPNYLAPETIHQPERMTIKSDIWGAGVIKFNLLFGVMPFIDERPYGLRLRILHCIYSIPEHQLSATTIALLQSILTIDKDKRPTAATILEDAFFSNDPPKMIAVPDYPEYSGSNILRILLKEFESIQPSGSGPGRKRTYNEMITFDPAKHLWLIGHLPAARNLGFMYVLSDGKIGILFQNGVTAFMLRDETSMAKIVVRDQKNTSTNEKERKKKAMALFILRDDLKRLYDQSSHEMSDSTHNEAIVCGYFRTRKMVIVLFNNAPCSIYVGYRYEQEEFEFLIGHDHIHLGRANDYRTYRRDNAPKIVVVMIANIVELLKKTKLGQN